MAAKKNRNKNKITVPPNGHQKTKITPFSSNTHQHLFLLFLTSFSDCRMFHGGLPVRSSPPWSLNLPVNVKRLLLGSLPQHLKEKARFGLGGPEVSS